MPLVGDNYTKPSKAIRTIKQEGATTCDLRVEVADQNPGFRAYLYSVEETTVIPSLTYTIDLRGDGSSHQLVRMTGLNEPMLRTCQVVCGYLADIVDSAQKVRLNTTINGLGPDALLAFRGRQRGHANLLNQQYNAAGFR